MSRDLVYHRRNDDGSVSVVFDEPGRPVNVLRQAVFDGMSRALDAIEALPAPPTQVRFVSGKPGTFIAGADLKVIRDASDAELDAVLKQGQDLLDRVAALPMTTVALIGGAALGGGLEVALACDARVAAAGDRAVIGLPEINLGILPGWGGTVRLPRCIGVGQALPLLFEGRAVTPDAALALGLVDAVVDEDAMGDAAARIKPKPPAGLGDSAALLEAQHGRLAELDPMKQRAAGAMLDTLKLGLLDGPRAGLDAERRHLVALRNTEEGRALIGAFFDKRTKK
jgi:3-hydroxyacyl-CoA dehydrogenase/enoyl-CoA hydratase/3-hydroxybutyryl-CoA epimerase